MGKKTSRILLLLLVISFLLTKTITATLHVEPVRLIFGLGEGERATGAIHVTNRGNETLNLQANLYDWTLNQRDEIINYESGTLKESLHGMIRFNPQRFTLEPGEIQIVRFTITIPPGQEEDFERRGIIFVEHEDFYAGDGMGATIKSMIGTTIYAIPASTEVVFRLLATQIHPGEGKDQWGALLVMNDGLAHLRYQITYRVVDHGGALVREGSIPQQFILPGFQKENYLFLGQLPKGKYTLHLFINLVGNSEELHHGISFQIEDD